MAPTPGHMKPVSVLQQIQMTREVGSPTSLEKSIGLELFKGPHYRAEKGAKAKGLLSRSLPHSRLRGAGMFSKDQNWPAARIWTCSLLPPKRRWPSANFPPHALGKIAYGVEDRRLDTKWHGICSIPSSIIDYYYLKRPWCSAPTGTHEVLISNGSVLFHPATFFVFIIFSEV